MAPLLPRRHPLESELLDVMWAKWWGQEAYAKDCLIKLANLVVDGFEPEEDNYGQTQKETYPSWATDANNPDSADDIPWEDSPGDAYPHEIWRWKDSD